MNKKELAVAALKNGTVIDHIPSKVLFNVVKILGLPALTNNITIGYNLESEKLGKKGIIKVADIEFSSDTIDRIALLAPGASVNIIRDYDIVEKRPVKLPAQVVNIVKCQNPNCITNHEPMSTKFDVFTAGDSNSPSLRCCYCTHVVSSAKAQMV